MGQDPIEPPVVCAAGTRDDLAVEAIAAANPGYRNFSISIARDLKKYLLAIAIDVQRLEANSKACPISSQTIDNIVRNATQADQALQILLDAASLEAGQFALRRTSVNLGKLVREAIARMPPARRAQVDLEQRVRMTAMLDPIRVETAISTLIHGALDHSTAGTHLGVVIDSGGSDRARIWFGIETGAFRDELEQAFATEDPVSGHDGRGVALRTIRTVIQAHGGDLVFDASTGDGGRICLELPATQMRGMLARRRAGPSEDLSE
jgi:K+-sensing histidine kinase KdpD